MKLNYNSKNQNLSIIFACAIILATIMGVNFIFHTEESNNSRFAEDTDFSDELVDAGYSPSIPTHWYKLDETGGSIAVDDGTTSVDGTNNGATLNQPAQLGTGYDFDGGDDYVRITHGPSFEMSEFTISSWVKFDSASGGHTGIVGKHKWGVDKNSFMVSRGGSTISFLVYMDSGAYSAVLTTATQANIWYMVTAVLNATNLAIYMNGTLEGVTIITSSYYNPSVNIYDLLIGAAEVSIDNIPQRLHDGIIDDVRVWGQALNGSDIAKLYKGLPTSNHPNDITTTKTVSEKINWTLYDDYGAGKYRVWANDTAGNFYVWQNWQSWDNGIQFSVPINRDTPGIFNYTIEYNDSQNQFGIPDTVIVTIADGTPTSDHPNDITTTKTGSETINWTLYDDYGDGQYRVWANDTAGNFYVWQVWQDWENGIQFSVLINRAAPGIFNYTIEYNDSQNQFGIPDTVIVTITDGTPTSDHPNDITTTKTGSETINWTLYDDYGSGQYCVWANDTAGNFYIWQNWQLWDNGIQFSVPINRAAPGIFNYTIEYNDTQNRFGIPDTVIITITDGIPASAHPNDIITTKTGSETINWTLFDDYGSGQYRVWANNSAGNFYVWQDWQPWENGIQFSVPINRTAAGIFNYTIEYYDNQNQFGIFDTVIITIRESVNNIISDDNDDNNEKEEVDIMPIVIIVSIVSGGIVIGIVVVLIKKGIIIGSKAAARIST